MRDDGARDVSVQRVTADRSAVPDATRDRVVVEEPLEIRVGATPVAVTMRTPGHDEELAVGFLFTECIIRGRDDVAGVTRGPAPGRVDHCENIVCVEPRDLAGVDLSRLKRHFYATSSCGVCGKASIEQVRQHVTPVDGALRLDAALVTSLPDRMRGAQTVFDDTGGLHAAALFNENGELLCVREDVGRHNAVDKVIGWALLNDGLPLDGTMLFVSGRASFEIVQKALVARIPFVGAVSAASSLAIDLAIENGMTLVGFIRNGRFVIYAGAERIS